MFTDEMKSGSVIFRLCLLCIWGALMFALKMAMASLPNVEPVTPEKHGRQVVWSHPWDTTLGLLDF